MNKETRHKTQETRYKVLSITVAIVFVVVAFFGYSFVKDILFDPSKELILGSQKIVFAFTDDNSNEDLIIRTDKKHYSGFDSSTVYFNITNKSSRSQEVESVFYFENAAKLEAVYALSGEDWTGLELHTQGYADLNNPRRKSVEGLKAENSFTQFIEVGETKYFKATIFYPAKSKGKFFIESFGSRSAYGHLDPWYNSFTNGLVGYWTFDGPDMYDNVADVSGEGNHGSLVGQTSTTTVPGKLGQALDFDGVDDYVYDDPTDQTGSFTVSFWAKAGSTGQDEFSGLFSSENPLADDSFQIDVGGSTDGCANMYGFIIKDSSGDGQDRICMGTYTTNWQFLTATWDGTTAKSYFNGVFQNSATPSYTGNIAEYIVGANRGLNNFFDGQIDEVRIYNRALSADEIGQLYRMGSVETNVPQNNKHTSGLVGHWTFDGSDMYDNVADVSGEGNHGSLVGQTSTTTTIGKLGQALDFDGSDDYVDTGIFTHLNGLSSLSVCAWVYLNTLGVSDNVDDGAIFAKGDAASNTALFWYNVVATGPNNHVYTFLVGDASTAGHRVNGNTVATANVWQYVCGVKSGTTGKIFLNGVVDNTVDTFPSTFTGSSSNADIGSWANSSDFAFDGFIDDVRVYNRALSADEIGQLYRMGGVKANVPQNNKYTSSLVGHWTFDGSDMYDNVADVSGEGNHGSLVGQTSTTTVIGKLGQALEFDGVDDRVPLSSTLSLTSSFTVSVWAKNDGGSDRNRIFMNGGDNGGWGVGFGNTAGEFRFTKSTVVDLDIDIGEWPIGWFYATWVVGSDNDVELFIDGISKGKYNNTLAITGTPNVINIGVGYYSSFSYYWQGQIDDVRIYNRALSADEISQLYRTGTVKFK